MRQSNFVLYVSIIITFTYHCGAIAQEAVDAATNVTVINSQNRPVPVEVTNPAVPASSVTVTNPANRPIPVEVTNPTVPASSVTVTNPANQPVPVEVTNAGNSPISVEVTNASNQPLPVTVISGGQSPEVSIINDVASAVPVTFTNESVKVEVSNDVNVATLPAVKVDAMPAVKIETMPDVVISSMPPLTVKNTNEPLPPWVKVGNVFPGQNGGKIKAIVGNWVNFSWKRNDISGQINIPLDLWIYLPTGKCYGEHSRLANPCAN